MADPKKLKRGDKVKVTYGESMEFEGPYTVTAVHGNRVVLDGRLVMYLGPANPFRIVPYAKRDEQPKPTTPRYVYDHEAGLKREMRRMARGEGPFDELLRKWREDLDAGRPVLPQIPPDLLDGEDDET